MIQRSEVPYAHRLPMHRMRRLAATALYRMLGLVLRTDRRLIQRRGIRYEVDLSEGLDLAVYVLRGFQRHVIHPPHVSIPPDSVILDVGANSGVTSLQYACLATDGQVYAFEPTHYAFAKLLRNLELNPELSKRIVPVQAFVSNQTTRDHRLTAHASWSLSRTNASGPKHPVHGGSVRSADQVGAISLDDFCAERGVTRVDLIKIDTDGHEYSVLEGARRSVPRYLPAIIFELGLYLMEERGVSFEAFDQYFSSLGYRLLNSRNGRPIHQANYLKEVPLRSTIDVVALPPTRTMTPRVGLRDGVWCFRRTIDK